MSGCCVVGCRNRYSTGGVKFFRIPRGSRPFQSNRRRLWLQAINRVDWNENVIKNSRVCGAHFISGEASLDSSSPDFVPSLFAHRKQSQNPAAKMDRYHRKMKRDDRTNTSAIKHVPSKTPEQVYSMDHRPAEVDIPVPKPVCDDMSLRHGLHQKNYVNLQEDCDTLQAQNQRECAANAPKKSLTMEAGEQTILGYGLGRELMDSGRFCFSCEQIFTDRKSLEEHMCSAASFICSCGTEFAEYKDMLQHSTTHEPGHQVLDHQTIKKRRIEKRMEEQQQLHRLQTTEVIWKSPNPDSKAQNRFANKSQVPVQIKQMSQVPQLNSAGSKEYFFPNPAASADVKNIFAGVGAPTVDLWMLYQPVVLLKMERSHKQMPYTCGKCGQGFVTKTSLVSHHSSHATDKVSGCIGCGLLLSSKKLVPRFHFCNAPPNVSKAKLITARPQGLNSINKIQSQASRVSKPPAAAPIQMKKQNVIAASKIRQASQVMSLQQKLQSIRAYNQTHQGLHITSQQVRSHNPRAPFPHVSNSLSPKGRIWNPNVRRNSPGLPAAPLHHLKLTMNSAPGTLSKPPRPSSSSGDFTCRVCHIPFDSAQVLQRHKCIKAHEFMAQHLNRNKHLNLARAAPVPRPNPAQINGDQKLRVLTSSAFRGQGPVPVNGKSSVEIDTDCYIVETGPEKPAEMIYQVTSSVPIKT